MRTLESLASTVFLSWRPPRVLLFFALSLAGIEPGVALGQQDPESLDFTIEGPAYQTAPTTAADMLRYAHLARQDAQRLEGSGVEPGSVGAAWEAAAAEYLRVVDHAAAGELAADARLLAADSLSRAGKSADAARLCVKWARNTTDHGERVGLLREAVRHGRQCARQAPAGGEALAAQQPLLDALALAQELSDGPPLERDERALYLHEAGELWASLGRADLSERSYRAALSLRPSLAVAESCVAGLLAPLRAASDLDAARRLLAELRATSLATRTDEKLFAKKLDEVALSLDVARANGLLDEERWQEGSAAMSDLARAHPRAPAAESAAYNAAWALWEARDPGAPDALLAFADRHPKHPKAAAAVFAAATLRWDAGQGEAAIAALEVLRARWPRAEEAVRASRELAAWYERDHRAAEAAAALDVVIATSPPDTGLLATRAARLYELAGQPRKALDHYARALESTQDLSREAQVELHTRAGLAAERAGQRAAARKHFEAAAQLASEHSVNTEWSERARARLTTSRESR
jgi:hypothetical protein